MSRGEPSATADLLDLAVHELRSPINVLVGYLRMLARQQLGPLNERQLVCVDDAERACARLIALVTEMGDLANLEARTAPIARDELRFDTLVDEVAASATDGRDRGVTVERQSRGGPLLVVADERRVRAALSALLSAVLQEQPGPGPVRVTTDARVSDGRPMAALVIDPGVDGESVLDDQGPAPRLNETRGGLGLVLPIARRVLEQLGGSTWSSGTDRALGAVAVLLPLKDGRPAPSDRLDASDR